VAGDDAQPGRTPLLGKIERTTVAASAYEAIRESILDGRFQPGDPLVESDVAINLDVSRGTVREALARLREDGLVEHVPPRGLAVRRFSIDDVVDIYNARIGVETVAIRLCARAGVDVTRLEQVVQEMVAAANAKDRAALDERELAFHLTLCELSGNRCVTELLARISAQVRMALALDNSAYDDPLLVAREHEQLVTAIRERDEIGAAEALVEHVVGSLTRQLGVARDRLITAVPT
jgi:DNA-binding GntR family transcriptional regulator